jgi:Rrf2 family protein
MTVSKSTRYALYAAAEMAAAHGTPVTVSRTARRYQIPASALAKIFQQLVRERLATGRRGIGGGYRLARPASKVTVLDVLQVFERSRPGACLLHGRSVQACPARSACRVCWIFEEVDELVECTYQSVTLETLVRRGERLGVPRERRRQKSSSKQASSRHHAE